MMKIFQYSENFQGKLFFRASAKLLKIFDITDEGIINEFKCIEQICKRFQALFGLN